MHDREPSPQRAKQPVRPFGRVLVASVALAVLGFLLWNRTRPPAVTEPSATARVELESVERVDASQPTESVASETRVAVTAATPLDIARAPAVQHRTGLVEIRGTFVARDGTPIEGVPLVLTGRRDLGDSSYAAFQPGSDDAPTTLQARSGADGSFSLSFAPREAFEFVLDATPHGLCALLWRWTDLRPDDVRDLGIIELEAGGSIVGRVVDARGAPLNGPPWTVFAMEPWPDLLAGREPSERRCATDPATGEFRIDDVPPGRVLVRAERDGTHRFDGPVVEVRELETVRVELVCPFDELATRISITVAYPPFQRASQHVEALVATGAGVVATAKPPTADSRCYTFDGVPPGRYSVRLDDPRYLPWSIEGVELGASVRAELQGSAAVRLAVVDAASGLPVERFVVRVRTDDPEWRSWTEPSFEVDTAVSDVVRGLLPIRQTLIVRADGYADCEVNDLTLAPNETRAVAVALSSGVTLSGRVTQPDGTAPDVPVVVRLVQARTLHGSTLTLLEDARAQVGARATNANAVTGEFEFQKLAAGRYLVQASASAALHGAVTKVEIGDSPAEQRIELAIPGSASVRGRVLVPEGEALDGLRLRFVPELFPGLVGNLVASWDWRRKLCITLGRDGSFDSGPLPEGRVRVAFALPDFCLPTHFGGSAFGEGGSFELGDLELVAGHDEIRDFDVRERFPGTLRVAFDLHGRSTVGTVFELCRQQENFLVTAAGASLGRDGPARVRADAGVYLVMLRAVDSSWCWIADGTVSVSNGRESIATFAVELFDGELELRTEDLEPQTPLRAVTFRRESALPYPSQSADVDAHRTVHLTLPAGRYILARSPVRGRLTDAPIVRFDWPPAPGAAEKLVLPRARR
ncbi:MAG: carboxypeptidase regulatory-like domain-containing protein [Planctomycetes bacterium]|nr:carboxypeptidase regulatory-like domain-containing protein [Planctomycetota bacterium]